MVMIDFGVVIEVMEEPGAVPFTPPLEIPVTLRRPEPGKGTDSRAKDRPEQLESEYG